MSCYICGNPIEEPRLDVRDMKLKPCGTCETVIQECIESYPKGDTEDPDDIVVYLDPDIEDYHEYRRPSKDSIYSDY